VVGQILFTPVIVSLQSSISNDPFPLSPYNSSLWVLVRKIADVSILFSHICDFDGLTTRLKPRDVVRLLNDLFSHFDQLTDDLGVYKVETIGDVYLVSCGCPEEYERKGHAASLCMMALDMQRLVQRMGRGFGVPVLLSIGIHSGEVIAGVVGLKCPRFRLMGDTMNVASRMSTTAIHGDIQLSPDSYARLKKNEFVCEPRGPIPVKGKGDMTVYVLKKSLRGHPLPSGMNSPLLGVDGKDLIAPLRHDLPPIGGSSHKPHQHHSPFTTSKVLSHLCVCVCVFILTIN
jgi:class 3 adenylate cyclase